MQRGSFEPTYNHGAPIYAKTYGIAAPLSSFPYWSREDNGMPVEKDNAAVKYISGPGIASQKQNRAYPSASETNRRGPRLSSASDEEKKKDDKITFLGLTGQLGLLFLILVIVALVIYAMTKTNGE